MDTIKLYSIAREKYAEIGINTDVVLEDLTKLSLSIDCNLGNTDLTGSSQVENVIDLKDDISTAISLIPGMHRINLDAKCYFTDDIVSIDELESRYFDEWVKWGKTKVKGIDIITSMNNHEMADTGYTLSSEDKGIRFFWIQHAIACRKIGEKFGRELISPSYVNIRTLDVHNLGKVNISQRQQLLIKSLDKIYTSKIDEYCVNDIISGSTNGDSDEYPIASELLCQQYSRKAFTVPHITVSSYFDDMKMHTMMSNALYFSNTLAVSISPSRGEKVITVDESIQKQIDYLVRNDLLDDTQIFINLSLDKENRLKQWVISVRNIQRAVLRSILMSQDIVGRCDEYMKIALAEEFKSYPMGAVWDYFCRINDTPEGIDYINNIK